MDAVDDLSDAIDATRELLLPVQVGRWLKLAIVVFFVGGGLGMGGGAPGADLTMVTEDPMFETAIDEIPEEIIALAVVLVAIAILLWLAFSLVGALMEFVFIESLRSQAVHVRRFSRENIGRGLRLFGFRLIAGLLALGVVAVPAATLVLDALTVREAINSLLPVFLLAIPVYFVYALVMRFTAEFVAPVMLLEERGVLGSWRRFWPTLTANWTEYVVYLLLVWVLQLVVSIAAGFVIVFGFVALAIPFVILAILFLALGEIGLWLAGAVGVVGVLTVLLFVAIVQMPIRTYFQYYALFLLGDTNSDFDLLPDQRAAIRANDDRRFGGASSGRGGRERHEDADEPGDQWDDESDSWDDSDLWADDSSDWDEPDDRDDDRDDRDRGW